MSALFNNVHLNENKSAVIAEFLGTFLFTLTIALSTISNEEVAPLAYGFLTMALVFCFGYLSGGHFNPAISFSVWVSGAKDGFGITKVILYTVSQTSAALAAALYCKVIVISKTVPAPDTPIAILNIISVIFSEAIFTFVLCSVQLHVACSKGTQGNNYYGFAVGMAVLSGGLVMGGIRGGAFNPAVATGLQAARCLTLDCAPLASVWIFWIGELAGATAAAVLYKLVTDTVPTGASS